MIKEWMTKQALRFAAKDLPKDQLDAIAAILTSHPEFFKKIEKELEEATKSGKPQVYAMMDVMKKHGKELQEIFAGVDPKVMQTLMSMGGKFAQKGK